MKLGLHKPTIEYLIEEAMENWHLCTDCDLINADETKRWQEIADWLRNFVK